MFLTCCVKRLFAAILARMRGYDIKKGMKSCPFVMQGVGCPCITALVCFVTVHHHSYETVAEHHQVLPSPRNI